MSELPAGDKPSRRQIVMNWLMRDDTTAKDGWWGGSEAVAYVDELLAALDAASPSASAPQYTVQVGDGPPMPITKEAFEGIFGKAALSHEGTNVEAPQSEVTPEHSEAAKGRAATGLVNGQRTAADASAPSTVRPNVEQKHVHALNPEKWGYCLYCDQRIEPSAPPSAATTNAAPQASVAGASVDTSRPVSPATETPTPAGAAPTPRTDAWQQAMYRQDCCLVTEPTFPDMLNFARQLERELAVYTGASSNKTDWCPCCKQGWGVAKRLAALSSIAPIAWRYRLKDSDLPWKLVDGRDEVNPLPQYESEPLYAAPVSASGEQDDDWNMRAVTLDRLRREVIVSFNTLKDAEAFQSHTESFLGTPDGRSQT